MSRIRPSFILLLLAFPSATPPAGFTGKVIGICVGDALTVLHDKTPVKIRLRGVDAPETGQDFGARAKQAASEWAFGQVVTVQSRDTDRYGRTVALVVLPSGQILNHELVRWASPGGTVRMPADRDHLVGLAASRQAPATVPTAATEPAISLCGRLSYRRSWCRY